MKSTADKKEEHTAIAGLVLLIIIGGLVLFKDTNQNSGTYMRRTPHIKGPTTPPPILPLPLPNGAQR